MTIVARAGASGPMGGSANVYGAKDATVIGGLGDDAIELKAIGFNFSAAVYGAFNTQINGGGGNDVLSFITETEDTSPVSSLYGLYQSQVAGGDGNDVIRAEARNTAGFQRGYGVFESQINGGDGNDRIIANTGDIGGTFDIQDAIIGGGAGDDTFEVGMGSGTIRGDEGNDTTILDFFNFETMTLETINGGLRISGTQDKSGREAAWVQNIFEVEQFQIGGATETADTLAAKFAG